jgi:hypothetical protein
MKKYLLLLATIITLTAKAQTLVYHAFPDSNAFWCGSEQWFDGTCDHNDISTIYFGNDTLINGNMYHTLRKTGCITSSLCSGSGSYYYPLIAAIRQDTLQHIVYMYDNSIAADTIFYDFNLQVGDTLDKRKVNWNGPPCTVTSVDSVLINGQYRKRFNHNCSNGCSDSSIIEGIGGISGLMSTPSSCFEYVAILRSFEQNGIGIYPDSTANCEITTGIKSILVNSNFRIYPNPVSDRLNVTLNSNELSVIILYDLTSRKLLQQEFTNAVSINTEQLAKGLYIYEVRSKNGLCRKGKIVKN